MNLKLIDLQDTDFPIVKEIYDHYVEHTTVTFHTEKISIPELKQVISINHPIYKSYLIDYNNHVCGYCYISQFKNRQAYNRTAEITIYLKPDFSGKSIGKPVIEKLEEIARRHNIHVLIGVITGDNYPSIKLFQKCGYEKCAHYIEVGEKFNKLLDVVAYQKTLV